MIGLDAAKREWHRARRGEEKDAAGWAGKYADDLLALARAGRRLAERVAERERVHFVGYAVQDALVAWREADGG